MARNYAAGAVLMIKPTDFEYNVETSFDNDFMHVDANPSTVRDAALREFANMVHVLRASGVQTIVFDKSNHVDLHSERMPDAVFPNNWFSTDVNGSVTIYPMAAASRNREKQSFRFIIEELLRHHFKIESVHNFAPGCEDGLALEGTGALIIDRLKKRVYCNKSKRADETLLRDWAKENGYEPVVFETRSSHNRPFYHTNVMLSIGCKFVVVCTEAIVPKDRERVLALLREDREVMEISMAQTEDSFCANILELSNEKGQLVIVMSQTAMEGFTPEQQKKLATFGELIVCPIPTIEKVGGGSTRCMLAEVFLPRSKAD